MTLMADVISQFQELLVSNEACLQFARECHSGAAIAPLQLWLPATLHTCLSLVGDGLVCSRLAVLWYSLNPLFCERA